MPAPYVIWMLSRTQRGLCHIAVNRAGKSVGYVLAFRTTRRTEVFVWQLGLIHGKAREMLGAAMCLCRALLATARRADYSRASFTTLPENEGLITRVLRRFPSLSLTPCARQGPSDGEQLYVVKRRRTW